MYRELKQTLRFVSMIAIPLCLVNSLVLSYVPPHFLSSWASRFFFSLALTFPQAVLYVSLVKWLEKRRSR